MRKVEVSTLYPVKAAPRFLRSRKKAGKLIKELSKRFQHIVVLFSGGKDSSTVAHLAMQAEIDNLTIVYADTLVEIPALHSAAMKVLQLFGKAGIRTLVVTPEPAETFWHNVLINGYPPPHSRFRWCVRRLKVNPVKRFLRSLPGTVAVLSGSRVGESQVRAQLMLRRPQGEHFEGVPEAEVHYPIREWDTEEVWSYLLSRKGEWADVFEELYWLYDGTGECAWRPDGTGYCNGTRTGCWVCTVVKHDRALHHLERAGDRLAAELLRFKTWFREFCAQPNNRLPASCKGRKFGALTKEAKLEITRKLAELSKKKEVTTCEIYPSFLLQVFDP